MKAIILLAIVFASTITYNTEYVENFEKGYKYVLDNQDQFENLSLEQTVSALQKQFNITHSIRIQNLTDVLNQGDHPWSNDLTLQLSTFNHGINTAQSFEDFLKALTIFENSSSSLSRQERDRVLRYISELLEITRRLINDLQYYGHCCEFESEFAGWWDRWGKCAASILAGAGTGLLAGAVVGTAHVPALGTVVGGVIGGVAGGLQGAASGC